jgi:alkylation response protein AidB-like acyl-CoA dehydrogenase
VGRLLLEAKSLEFGEGTSELHRKLIAEYALGIRKQ